MYRRANEGDEQKTFYDMFLYKNPGFQKVLRFKLHSWGVQTMTKLAEHEKKLLQKTGELTNKIKNQCKVSLEK